MRRWLIPIIAAGAFGLFSVVILSHDNTNGINTETKQHRSPNRDEHVARSVTAIVVLITTFYPSPTDVRYAICLDTLKAAKIAGLEVVVVDASPDERVRDEMRLAGTHVHVFQQTADDGKGGALRQALREGMKLPGVTLDSFMCFQEPEKTALIHEWTMVVAAAKSASAFVVMPAREPALFKSSYPVEQWHSESFANALITAMAIDAGVLEPYQNNNNNNNNNNNDNNNNNNDNEPTFDWHFGPVGFQNTQSSLWLEHTGTLWDAQLIPVVHACAKRVRALSVTVPYAAPPEMKQQEQGNIKFIEKRLMQINFLVPKFKQAFVEVSNKNKNKNRQKKKKKN